MEEVMNFGLSQLWKEKFRIMMLLLITNDTEFSNYNFVSKLTE